MTTLADFGGSLGHVQILIRVCQSSTEMPETKCTYNGHQRKSPEIVSNPSICPFRRRLKVQHS